jgi:two-component system, cell cycle sensor histidine kinase and response regulator CckA
MPAVRRETAQRSTILVVHRDAAILMMIKVILEQQGYRVVVAKNSGSAKLMAAQELLDLDLAIIDTLMPDVSGSELAASLNALRPALRVLFVSAFTDGAVVRIRPEMPDSAGSQDHGTGLDLVGSVRNALNPS